MLFCSTHTFLVFLSLSLQYLFVFALLVINLALGLALGMELGSKLRIELGVELGLALGLGDGLGDGAEVTTPYKTPNFFFFVITLNPVSHT